MNALDDSQTFGTRRLARYKAALKRSMRRVGAYRRRLRRRAYALRQWDRMRTRRFHPAFLFPWDAPADLKVLVVLPHHHEAAKIGGFIRMLLAREEGGPPHPRYSEWQSQAGEQVPHNGGKAIVKAAGIVLACGPPPALESKLRE